MRYYQKKKKVIAHLAILHVILQVEKLHTDPPSMAMKSWQKCFIKEYETPL